jgi:hypothetical protein
MNYTQAVFLINKHCRAIKAIYEPDTAIKKQDRELFKTLDPLVKTGDYVLVETNSRHNMTICQVVETDVDIDFDSSAPVRWIIQIIDPANYQKLVQQETDAISAIKSAELRKKRDDLKKAMFADHLENIKALPIYANGESDKATIEPDKAA